MLWHGMVDPSAEQRVIAEQTLTVISERFGAMPTYGRVDLVTSQLGTPLVLEVELIDPYLSLDMESGSATSLSSAIERVRRRQLDI